MSEADDITPSESEWLGRQLKEAREALGLPQAAVADHLGIPRPSVSEMEAGRRKVTFLELQRLAKLYRRPLSFFTSSSEAESEPETDVALFRAAAELSPGDREQVLRFAQFLRDAGPAKAPSRDSSGAG
jgi:transcriptional regulator with XRE-family HTH domain